MDPLSLSPSTRIDGNLAQAAHRFAPQLVESLGQALGQLPIAQQQRRESPVFDKGMIERQHHRVLVDDVKRVAQFSGVANTGDMTQILAMAFEEIHQRAGRSDTRIQTPCGRGQRHEMAAHVSVDAEHSIIYHCR
jgi:hypothetical protein